MGSIPSLLFANSLTRESKLNQRIIWGGFSPITLILNKELVPNMNIDYVIKYFKIKACIFKHRWNELGGYVIPTGRLQV